MSGIDGENSTTIENVGARGLELSSREIFLDEFVRNHNEAQALNNADSKAETSVEISERLLHTKTIETLVEL
jgi:hypothetical protein